MKFWRKPLDADSYRPPRGEVHILPERCKGCHFCVEFCPKDVLDESEAFNSKGYHPPEVVRPEACVGCRLCELLCPEFAIYVIVDDQQTDAETADDNDVGSETGPTNEPTSEEEVHA